MIRQYSVGVKAPRDLVTIFTFGNTGKASNSPAATAWRSTLRTATKYWLIVIALWPPLKALAAVAAVGASYAQVSITGKLGFAIQADQVVGGGKTKGMAISDGDINFAASEDLGGGLKASVSSAMKLRGRDNIGGRNGTITLSNSNVVVTAGAVEVGSTLTNAWVSAPASFASGPDNDTVLDGYSNVDILGLTLPMGALSLSAAYVDGSPTVGAAGSGQGLGQATQLSVAYAKDGLSLTADVTNTSSSVAAADGGVRTRVTGSYDFGPVALGIGFQMKNKNIATQTAFGISAPLGAVTVGLTYNVRAAQAISADAGITAASVERTGATFGATYAMSKTTSLYGGFATYTGIATQDSEYRIRLMKSF